MITLEKLTVNDAYLLFDEDPVVLSLNDAFSLAIHDFAHQAELRGLFVVDHKNRFAGVITRTDLLDWARVKLGAIFHKPLTDTDKTIRLVNLINAETVGDVLHPETINTAVLPSDSLALALQKMIDADSIILPVIDESQHIIGSLTLSELLDRVLVEES